MPPRLFVIVMTILGTLCFIWSAIAIVFPRYSIIASLRPRQRVENVSDRTVEAHDPVEWRGLDREDPAFTVRQQRRAGVMVAIVGVVLFWIAYF